MAEITLTAEPGRETGSRPARRLRHAGRIPGVLYGEGVDAEAVSVDARELRQVLSGVSGTNALLKIRLGDRSFAAMARELQRHPVRGTVVHVDFQVVDPDQPVTAEVPLVTVGEAVELDRADGLLEQALFTLPVRAKPSEIPSSIEVDVSALAVGDHIRAGEIALPPGVVTDVDPETIVVVGQPPRVERAEEEIGTEGETPAAGQSEGGANTGS